MNHARLYEEADAAGKLAADARVPTRMFVQRHANQMDDSSPVVQAWAIPGGVCGFAWITVRPGGCPFANWLKKTGKARLAGKTHGGGVQIWVSDYGQSMERKDAYASAFADVLDGAGVKAYAGSRMD